MPADSIRAIVAKLPRLPGPPQEQIEPSALCFATRSSPPGEFQNIYGIHRAVIYVPAGYDADAIAACLDRVLPDALGYRRPPANAPGIDRDAIAALSVIYDPRVRANMSRAEVGAIFGIR